MKNSDQATDSFDGIKLVPEPSEKLLNERQYLDYRSEREHCPEWLLTFGKHPDTADGYAQTTVRSRGVEFRKQPEEMPFGIYAIATDLEGNEINLLESPGMGES